MPEIVFPTSDIGRLALLSRIHKTATGLLADGAEQGELAAFLQSLTVELGDFLTTYRPTVTAVQDALGERMEETEERRQTIARLDMLVRDFFVVLKRRMRRNDEPAKLWRTYGIQSDGRLPPLDSSDELLEWGARIVEGDEKAAAAGYPKMVNPSAKQVQTALKAAHAKMDNVPQADIAYNRAQAAARAQRAQADAFIRRVNMLLDYHLYGHDPADIRRIKRTFGFVFRYQTGEARDPDDVLDVEPPDDVPDVDADELTPVV